VYPIYRIARREFDEHWRRLFWPAVALSALLVISFGFGWHAYDVRSTQRRAIQDAERARWLAQRYRSPHVAASQGIYVFRPLSPLAALEPGVDSFIGIATHAEEERHLFVWKPAEDELVARRFGEVSVASVFQFVVPLIIIVLLYPTYTRDRETGILRLTMSLGVRRWHYVIGKLLGSLAPALVLAPVCLAIAVALRIAAGEAAFAEVAPALRWMGVSYLLLACTFAAVCLGVSAAARSSRASLSYLLGFWCLTGFVLPHLAVTLEARLNLTPTAAEVARALDEAEDARRGPNPNDEIRDIELELERRYGVSTVAALPVSPVGVWRVRAAERGEPLSVAAVDPVYDSYLRHDRSMQWFSAASPMLAVQNISSSLAGTGLHALSDLAHAVEGYRYTLNQTMNRDIAENAPPTIPGNRMADDYHRGIEVWSQVPAFTHQPVDLATTIRRQQIAWSMLTLWCALAIAFAAFQTSRMRVDA
jgi:ABC-2 type transport system permease protein